METIIIGITVGLLIVTIAGTVLQWLDLGRPTSTTGPTDSTIRAEQHSAAVQTEEGRRLSDLQGTAGTAASHAMRLLLEEEGGLARAQSIANQLGDHAPTSSVSPYYPGAPLR